MVIILLVLMIQPIVLMEVLRLVKGVSADWIRFVVSWTAVLVPPIRPVTFQDNAFALASAFLAQNAVILMDAEAPAAPSTVGLLATAPPVPLVAVLALVVNVRSALEHIKALAATTKDK